MSDMGCNKVDQFYGLIAIDFYIALNNLTKLWDNYLSIQIKRISLTNNYYTNEG